MLNQILQRYMLPIGFPQSYMPLIGTALPGVLLLISFCRQRYICTASNQLRNKTEGVLPISFTKRYVLPIGFAQTNILLPVLK